MRLAHPRELPERAAAGLSGTWAYVGRDDFELRRWEAALAGKLERLPVGAALQDAAARLRTPFLTALAEAGKANDSLEWWSGRIADEDTLTGSLFFWTCALEVVRTLRAGPRPPVLIVSENEDFLAALGDRSLLRPRLRDALLAAGRWARWAWRSLGEWAAARRSGAPAPLGDGKGAVLLHTWAGPGYFAKDGPKDAYFGPLAKLLTERGKRVVVLPFLQSPGRPRVEALAWLRKSGDHLIAEDHYSLVDYIWAAAVAFRAASLPGEFPKVAGLDLSVLVARERRLQRANTSKVPFIMYARLVSRLAERGFQPDAAIQTFENSADEKPLLIAARENWPRTLTVGYQHNVSLLPMMVQHFTAPDGPQPQRIVCCSPFLKGLLERHGFKPETLRVGPSLRYLSILPPPPPHAPEPNTVLVCLSLEAGGAVETAFLVGEALRGRPDVKVRVKPHPMTPQDLLARLKAELSGPKFEFVSGRVEDWSARSACAVVAGSTVSMDFALAGVPVVQVGRETALDFDPLAYFDGFPRPVRDAAALRREVEKALAAAGADAAALMAQAGRLRAECLSPLTPESMDAFLPEAACAV
ncbi:MAG: hypothetical protein HYZ75_10485 [Elusimicrobia bacterium]|nr:hypothetical protein [Elusimicrobiota bacterium]